MQTLIRGLLQEPSDLGLHCLQRTLKVVTRAEWLSDHITESTVVAVDRWLINAGRKYSNAEQLQFRFSVIFLNKWDEE